MATVADADIITVVLRRSITESCVSDHRNDAVILETWLSNKTPERVRSWIASADSYAVVAERDDAVVGCAMLTMSGEVSLCYLVPEAQGRGLGRAMIAAVEGEAVARGLAEIDLRSTQTAHAFYLRVGFVDAGPPQRGRFITAQPMRKILEHGHKG